MRRCRFTSALRHFSRRQMCWKYANYASHGMISYVEIPAPVKTWLKYLLRSKVFFFNGKRAGYIYILTGQLHGSGTCKSNVFLSYNFLQNVQGANTSYS